MALEGFDPNKGRSTGIITSTTPGSGPNIPFKTGFTTAPERTEATESQLVQQYRAMSPALRKSLAAQLKSAGYRVPVTSKYSSAVRDAMISAYDDFNAELAYLSQNDPYQLQSKTFNLEQFLKDKSASGGGDGGQRKPYYQREISTKAEARTLVNEIYRDLMGRGASDDEFQKYYKKITDRQKARPTKTTYTEKGGGVMGTTTGGANVGDYLYQQIAGSDEAKARKVLSFYDAFKQALGVD